MREDAAAAAAAAALETILSVTWKTKTKANASDCGAMALNCTLCMYSAGFRGGALHPIDLRGEDTGRTRERERGIGTRCVVMT